MDSPTAGASGGGCASSPRSPRRSGSGVPPTTSSWSWVGSSSSSAPWRATRPAPPRRRPPRFIDSLPHVFDGLWAIAADLPVVWAAGLLVIALVARARRGLVRDMLLAGVIAGLVAVLCHRVVEGAWPIARRAPGQRRAGHVPGRAPGGRGGDDGHRLSPPQPAAPLRRPLGGRPRDDRHRVHAGGHASVAPSPRSSSVPWRRRPSTSSSGHPAAARAFARSPRPCATSASMPSTSDPRSSNRQGCGRCSPRTRRASRW